MLFLVPALAGPTSALINGMTQKSSSKAGLSQSEINPAALIEDIKIKLAATRKQLTLMPSDEVAGPASTELNDESYIAKRRFYLRELAYIYRGQLARLATLQEIQKNRIGLEQQASDWSGFSEQSEHPFLSADELLESIQTLGRRLDDFKSWSTVIDQIGVYAMSTVHTSTIKLRQADEAVEQAKNSPEQQARLSSERDLLALQNQIDMARAVGFQIEKQMNQETLLETRATLQLARKQYSAVSEHLELTQQDIEQLHKNLELKRQHIIAEIKQAVSALETINKEKPVSSITGGTAKLQSATQEQIEQIHQMQLGSADTRLQALDMILNYLELQQNVWDLRFTYTKISEREKVKEAYARIGKYQKFLQIVYEYINQQRQSTLKLVTNQAIKNIDQPVTGLNTLDKTRENLDFDQVISYTRLLGAIESTENLLERFKQELEARFPVKSFSDYLQDALLTTRDLTLQLWGFELFAVQDTIEVDGQQISGKRSITFGKVVTALAILIFGYWIAARLAQLIEGIMVSRFSMDASLARIARRWILFVEVMILVVASMLVVRIPLTIFAFMGGAVAIGAGFGMQNLLKNLISGLMLLMERPFRPGDMVEVGGIRGRITDIGVRSSQILEANGIETLIPNSTFIEQNVTNWTLSDQSVRIVVNIGVAYGSPIKEVTRLLIEVADRHGLVLKEPAPFVLFEDFGSDALLFGLYVWVELKREVHWKVIASDLRYMIHKTMDEHGIVIAFPQRDVHIDSSRPLDVRVLADVPDAGGAKE
ncbi:MAG: mechanosensitive ion channel domain-containing protein [Gammaproteobacteria bacterium]